LQEIFIDIENRDPYDHSDGIPYKLIVEGCWPAFESQDFSTIFEEHHICHTIQNWQFGDHQVGSGVYIIDEKKFIFTNVIVGSHAKARFRFHNANKVSLFLVSKLNVLINYLLRYKNMYNGCLF
jgi:hydrocephalus-inducing protein